jgi:hypothetical protein
LPFHQALHVAVSAGELRNETPRFQGFRKWAVQGSNLRPLLVRRVGTLAISRGWFPNLLELKENPMNKVVPLAAIRHRCFPTGFQPLHLWRCSEP